ncbi:MAG: hypothetical protein IH624_10200 [Phycisphaerae bacterium]|nr:hypothetical protein [Phycisphaerae bacterium]
MDGAEVSFAALFLRAAAAEWASSWSIRRQAGLDPQTLTFGGMRLRPVFSVDEAMAIVYNRRVGGTCEERTSRERK